MLAGACSDGGDNAPPPAARSRVNAVAAKEAPKLDPADFCEHYATADSAKKLTWPALRQPAEAADEALRWINVWATWCAPCVEELPRIAAWKKTVGKRVDYEMVFVAADGEPADVASFAKTHPEVEGSLELATADALAPWLQGLGLEGTSLPVHLFVDRDDNVRCVRMSGIGDGDEEAVAQLLSGL